jgi:3'(2'), 5'-bisphosphate nucleotidase
MNLLPEILHIAADTGACIMQVYQTAFQVTHKADHSPLTEADRAAHALICERLQRLTPEIPVISEESESIPAAERLAWPRVWLVDPLDGTKEFIKRSGEFTVNIALIEQHRPVLGVIFAPAMKVWYYGSTRTGAYKHMDQDVGTPIHTRTWPIHAPCFAGSREHGAEALLPLLTHFADSAQQAIGSSLKFGLVAEGRADAYVRLAPTSEWDTAAGQAILEAAGGQVLDTHGNPLRYNMRDTLLNPHFVAVGDASRAWPALQPHLS